MCSTSLLITRKASTQINQQHFKCATSKLTSAETTTTTTMTLRIPVVLLFFIFFSLFSGFSCEKQEALSFSNFLERRPLATFFYRYWSEDEDVDDEETKKNVHSTDDKPLVVVNTSSPAYRRQFIVNMTAEAWAAYREHAWGAELLRPSLCSTTRANNFSGSILATSGGTIVASMSTLWVMGLKREFEQGRAWIASHLNMSAFRSGDDNEDDGGNGSACSSQTTSTILVSHHIGSLLSCYALTGDDLFLKKATQIDGQLRPSPSQTSDRSGSGSWPWRRPPRSSSKSKNCKKRRRRRDRQSLLSEWAHQVLEYRYLSALTGDRRYRSRVTELEKEIRQKGEDEEKGGEGGTLKKETDFGVKEDNHLMAKVKSFLQSNGRDEPSLEDFLRVFIHLLPNIRTFPELNVTYIVGQVPSSSSSSSSSKPFHHHRRSSKYRHYRDCSLGAMFALAAKAAAINQSPPSTRNHHHTTIISHPIARYMADLADRLTESCHTVARQTATGLPPYAFYVEDQSGSGSGVNKGRRALTFPQPSSSRLRSYNLDPELAEAYFTLYRTTRREKWRQYAWELVQAIHRHCRVVMGNGNGAAYSALVDVTKAPPVKRDVQTPVFLGATLKYLYLTFLDDEDDAAENSLPLSSWLFNAVGQPLPIAGRNAAYLQ